ncbi:hypothetical protein [Acinetobacter towneri]|uniref:hypothetical protein n=1 Tax=Acinetobacter towneri TaxID=202956 RepID=UPI001436B0FE|nr:hypothetical protein [Acinetobacter towneri]MCA4814489.1 hypothetical protein [Acinetobacter towneri]QIV93094.1 hypothetical protein GVU25_09985 [Acinetobacter towneri]
MSKFIKTAAALMVFGAFSTVTMAGGNHHPKPDPKPTPVCNEGPCTGSIPIQVIVPKRCELKVKTPSISLKDGAEASGQFMVGANAKYNLLVDTDNRVGGGKTTKSAAKSGNHAVGLTVETKRAGSPSLIQLNDQQTNIAPGNNGWSTYNVLVKSDGVGISKPAGTYTDKYNIRVSF